MAQQEIDVGSFAGDGTGDPLRDAFTKINENFTELYSGNVQVTGANVLVYSVAGRTGNVVLNVNDVSQAASKSYVDNAIASNLANVTGSITDSLRANITAANTVISNHESRITVLESNAATQAASIVSLQNTKATIAYVDQSIDLALSSNAILADVASVNANVAAANAAILTKASLSGAIFTGNVQAGNLIANTGLIAASSVRIGENLGFAPDNSGGSFVGNTSSYYSLFLQNLNPNGYGEFLILSDDGEADNNYIAVGMAGSSWSDPLYPNAKPHDGTVDVNGGNLVLSSETHNVQIVTANITRISFGSTGTITMQSGTSLVFPDGTRQTTAFGGNLDVTAINANITAANLQITALQSNAASQSQELNSLSSNAGSQASAINTLTANSAAQASEINSLNANIGSFQVYANSNASSQATQINSINANLIAANINISSLLANASAQSLELDNLQSNAQLQQGNIISLQSNAASQAVQINLLNANLTAANTNISTLFTNVSQISIVNANVAAANINITNLQSNAASQALDINNLYANVNYYLSNVASSDANIAAANARIIILDANLGSTTTNVSVLQSNAAAQAITLDLINANIAAANIAISNKADLSGAIFNGNVQAEYLLANANVKIASIIEVGDINPIDYPGLGGVFVGNVDSYYQVVVQNTNSGSNASGDFVITADDGSDTDKYLNIGINSSQFSGTFTPPTGDTGLPEAPYDGYFNVIGGNAIVRTNQNVYLVANTSAAGIIKDGNFGLFNCNLAFIDGSIQRSAITDVPGLYANIGALSLFQANILGNATYTPNNAANYNGTITNIQQALDELAARLKALGG